MQTLYHIARAQDWNKAKEKGIYSVSTLNKSLESTGYIHLSFADQIKPVAEFIYKDIDDLLLLKITPSMLTSKVIVEAAPGTKQKFPHLYGPLNIDAVEQVQEYQKLPDGTFPAVVSD